MMRRRPETPTAGAGSRARSRTNMKWCGGIRTQWCSGRRTSAGCAGRPDCEGWRSGRRRAADGRVRAWQTDRAAAVTRAAPPPSSRTRRDLARKLRPGADGIPIEVVDLPRSAGRPFGPRFGSLVHATIATVALDADACGSVGSAPDADTRVRTLVGAASDDADRARGRGRVRTKNCGRWGRARECPRRGACVNVSPPAHAGWSAARRHRRCRLRTCRRPDDPGLQDRSRALDSGGQ